MVTERGEAHRYSDEEFSDELYFVFEKYFSSRSAEDFEELIHYCADNILEAYAQSVEDGEHAYDIMGTLKDEGGRGSYNRALFLTVGRAIATRLSGKTPSPDTHDTTKE